MANGARSRLACVAAATLAVCVAACGCDSGRIVQNSEAKSAAGWTVKTIESTQPATVSLKARSQFGGTEPAKDEPPPAGQQWVVMTAEMTPPSAGADLPASQLVLADESGSAFPALAMAAFAGKPPSFVYFTEMLGLGQMNAAGEIPWMVSRNAATGETKIDFLAGSGQKVALLFAVPASAKGSLTFRF